jgi:hypothetical protein
MGFLEDIEKILPSVGPNRQIMVREINKEISEEEMQLFATR